MKDLHHSCQGESHIATNKVCQDASYSATDTTMSIAIVCDGHGGARYFRSDVGAKFAVDATKECVDEFVSEIDKGIFVGKSFTQKKSVSSEAQSNILSKDTTTDKALRQLFSSIIFKWREKIVRHALETPLTIEEESSIESKFKEDFIKGVGVEKTYGCTLMCFVYTEQFWFAFHIGDGKCIAFNEDGSWHEPIPWDEKCFLNKTTSLCDSSAIDEFRYCYCGDGTFPLAVFLGSDGIDDSFGETKNMVNFYIQVLKLINKEGHDNALANIKDTLPQLSKIGSKDDMSLSCIYDDGALAYKIKYLISWQRHNVEQSLFDVNNRILKLKEEIKCLVNSDLRNQKSMINYQYAQKNLTKAFDLKKTLANKWNKFSEELVGDSFRHYTDEIGFGEMQSPENLETHNVPDNSTLTEEVDPISLDETAADYSMEKTSANCCPAEDDKNTETSNGKSEK